MSGREILQGLALVWGVLGTWWGGVGLLITLTAKDEPTAARQGRVNVVTSFMLWCAVLLSGAVAAAWVSDASDVLHGTVGFFVALGFPFVTLALMLRFVRWTSADAKRKAWSDRWSPRITIPLGVVFPFISIYFGLQESDLVSRLMFFAFAALGAVPAILYIRDRYSRQHR